MSRTYKDIDWEIRFPQEAWSFGKEQVPAVLTYRNWRTKELESRLGTVTMAIAGAKSKKKRSADVWYRWYRSTPSSWVSEFMTAPKRAKCRNWEKDVVKLHDVEDAGICPDFGNKPHHYYW